VTCEFRLTVHFKYFPEAPVPVTINVYVGFGIADHPGWSGVHTEQGRDRGTSRKRHRASCRVRNCERGTVDIGPWQLFGAPTMFQE